MINTSYVCTFVGPVMWNEISSLMHGMEHTKFNNKFPPLSNKIINERLFTGLFILYRVSEWSDSVALSSYECMMLNSFLNTNKKSTLEMTV